ncbi:hypothetical protein IWQ57_002443, partial [Coemansia nantahalensis]
MVTLIPPDEDQDVSMACLLSDTQTMRHLEFMMRPSGYTARDARARRERRAGSQQEKALLDYTIAIRRSRIPESLLAVIGQREFLPPRQIPVDDGCVSMDEPYVVIGCCGLNDIDLGNRHADAGIILDARFWRSGASTDALYQTLRFGFEMLGLHRIGMQTTENNAGMRGWLEAVAEVEV